jgi:hypothetical protein
MAFRIEAAIGAILIAASVVQGASHEVQHDHLRGRGAGTLTVTNTGISFRETGRHEEHSRDWKWTDVQQLVLSPTEMRVLTYEDQKWRLGRDREYVFTGLAKDFVEALSGWFRTHLGQRFVEAVAETIASRWQVEARLQKKFSGTAGTLTATGDQVIFATKRGDESRTWRIDDVDSISSSGPYDLTITTYERSGFGRADRRDFHFQLKERLPESSYNALWRSVNQAKGLKDLNTLLPTAGEHHETKTR